MTFSVEKITPQMAKDYLKANTRNPRGQNLNRARVKAYAEDMKAGRWELNGEAICFDVDGILKNGAHRLAAIALSGATVEILVVRGVDKKVTAYDITYIRTLAQMANADDVSVPKVMLSAVKTMYSLMSDAVGTHMEIKAYAKKHEDELNRAYRSLLNGDNSRWSLRTSCALAAYLMLQTGKMPFYEVEVFFRIFATGVANGTDGYEATPPLVARRMFDERWTKAAPQKVQKEQLDVLIQAMTDFHDGKKRANNYKISQPFSFEPMIRTMGGK